MHYARTIDYEIVESSDLAAPAEEEIDVYCWRMEQLIEAGFSGAVAAALAGDAGIDLHLACDLLARGCPPGTAYRIVV